MFNFLWNIVEAVKPLGVQAANVTTATVPQCLSEICAFTSKAVTSNITQIAMSMNSRFTECPGTILITNNMFIVFFAVYLVFALISDLVYKSQNYNLVSDMEEVKESLEHLLDNASSSSSCQNSFIESSQESENSTEDSLANVHISNEILTMIAELQLEVGEAALINIIQELKKTICNNPFVPEEEEEVVVPSSEVAPSEETAPFEDKQQEENILCWK